jgi:hypothetical protein
MHVGLQRVLTLEKGYGWESWGILKCKYSETWSIATYYAVCFLPNYHIIETFVPKLAVKYSEDNYRKKDREHSVNKAVSQRSAAIFKAQLTFKFLC